MTFTHTNASGHVHMVDVSDKQLTLRRARAQARVRCSEKIMRALNAEAAPKGDVWATVRIAGIQAAKQAATLLPLAHPLRLTHVAVEALATADGVEIEAAVATRERTGIEMEALTAATCAALALVDMVKGIDRDVEITSARIVAKSGGKTGTWERDDHQG